MARHRVPLWNQPQRSAVLDDAATEGAVVGVNLRWGTGALVTEAELRSGGSSSGVGITDWSLVMNIPENIVALAGLSGAGFPTRSVAGAWTQRAITGAAGRITVTNGDGVSDAPSIDLDMLADGGAGSLLRIDRDAYGRVAGTSAPNTDDLSEGVTNLYYTDTRADARITAWLGTLAALTDAADDAAAALAGVPVGGMYRTGSTLKVRIT